MLTIVAIVLLSLYIMTILRKDSWVSLLMYSLLSTVLLIMFVSKPWFVVLGSVLLSISVIKVLATMLRGEGVLLHLTLLLLFFLIYEGVDVLTSLLLGWEVTMSIILLKLRSILLVVSSVSLISTTYYLWHEKEV